MRFSARTLFSLLLAATLTASCVASGVTASGVIASDVWIPPSSPDSARGRLALAAEEGPPGPAAEMSSASAAAPTPPTPASPAPSPTPPVQPTLPPTEATPVAAAIATPALPTETAAPLLYEAQAADTLPVVAVRFGVEPEEIESAEPIPESAYLTPGQLLIIPRRLGTTTSSTRLIPDSEVVYSPSAANFDPAAFADEAGGKLMSYSEWLQSTGKSTGPQIILRVALENSINPRLLLSLLEYGSGWVSGQPQNAAQRDHPLGWQDPNVKGLYHQLVWAVNQLSIGYYAYREGRLTEIRFADGTTARLAPDLNAGTAALQYYFAQLYSGQAWLDALNPETGFPALHARLFGDPWARAAAVEPLFPGGVEQPPLNLPFQPNWTWAFTGGPHGAWEYDGAYAALDFAPGSTKPGCIKTTAWATAASAGLVVRSGKGIVALDLDGDGQEGTGWVLVYLHVSDEGRAPVGSWVGAGDPLGHPSCEGGFATGTHLHIARKFNGEWIPAAGPLPFNLGGWVAGPGDGPYKGTMTRGDVTVIACTCSSSQTWLTRTDNDP